MTEATVQRLKWTASLNLAEYFAGITPETYKDVIQAGAKRPLSPFPKMNHRGTKENETA